MKAIQALSVCAALVILFFANRFVGMHQIGGFDSAPMIDLAWRLHQGQRAFTDFYTPYPPLFTWGAAIAFRVEGVSWQSLVDAGGVFYAVGTIAVYFVWKRITAPILAAALGLLAFTQGGLFHGFWWYSPVALYCSLLFLGILAVGKRRGFFSFGAANSSAASSRAGWGFRAAVVLLSALLVLGKPNMTGPALFFGFLQFMLPARLGGWNLWRQAVAFSVAALALAVVASFVFQFNPISYVQALFSLSHRVSSPTIFMTGMPWSSTLQSSAVIALLLTVLGFFVFNGTRQFFADNSGAALWIFLGLFASFLGGFFLNGEFPITSCPLLAGALLFAAGPSFNKKQIGAIGLCFVIAAVQGELMAAGRSRVWGAGDGQFFETNASIVQTDPFFKGVVAGPRLTQFTADAAHALRLVKPASVFFGPRVEFGYAQFQKASPEGFPLWWDPLTAYPRNEKTRQAILSRWESSHFDLIILDRVDNTYLPSPISEDIHDNYMPISNAIGAKEAGIFVSREWVARHQVKMPNGQFALAFPK